MKAPIAVLALLAALPAAAFAQDKPETTSGLYGSVGYAQTVSGGDAAAVQGRVGSRLNRFVGMETEISGGVDRDRAVSSGLAHEADLDRQGAAYGVAYMPLSPKADVFARVGYGSSKSRAFDGGSPTGDSVNYGAGAQYFPDGRNGLRADFTRHDFRDRRVKANIFSVGYIRRF